MAIPTMEIIITSLSTNVPLLTADKTPRRIPKNTAISRENPVSLSVFGNTARRVFVTLEPEIYEFPKSK